MGSAEGPRNRPADTCDPVPIAHPWRLTTAITEERVQGRSRGSIAVCVLASWSGSNALSFTPGVPLTRSNALPGAGWVAEVDRGVGGDGGGVVWGLLRALVPGR
jgi:hypothetical protein